MRHHFRRPQAMFNKGSLFYRHCGEIIPRHTLQRIEKNIEKLTFVPRIAD
jgi:hypothetical protein